MGFNTRLSLRSSAQRDGVWGRGKGGKGGKEGLQRTPGIFRYSRLPVNASSDWSIGRQSILLTNKLEL